MPNSNFRRICNKKQWLTETHAFSMSTVTRKRSSVSVFAISNISEIFLPISFINFFLKICHLIRKKNRKGNTFFMVVEKTLLINFHICIKQWYQPPVFNESLVFVFFFNIFITVCFWELLDYWFRNALLKVYFLNKPLFCLLDS